MPNGTTPNPQNLLIQIEGSPGDVNSWRTKALPVTHTTDQGYFITQADADRILYFVQQQVDRLIAVPKGPYQGITVENDGSGSAHGNTVGSAPMVGNAAGDTGESGGPEPAQHHAPGWTAPVGDGPPQGATSWSGKPVTSNS